MLRIAVLVMFFVCACSDRPTRSEEVDRKLDEAIDTLQKLNEQARSYYVSEDLAALDRRLQAIESTLADRAPAVADSETLETAMEDPQHYAYGLIGDDAGTQDVASPGARGPKKGRARTEGARDSTSARTGEATISLYRTVASELAEYEKRNGRGQAFLDIRKEFMEISVARLARDESLRPVAEATLKRLRIKIRKLPRSPK